MAAPTRRLIQDALEGDAAAMRTLLEVIRPAAHVGVSDALRLHLKRGSWRREEVEDLTQEVMAALFEKKARLLRAWDPALGAALPGYVKLIARCRATSILRSTRPGQQTWDPLDGEASGLPDPGASFVDDLEQIEIVQAVLAAVEEELTPDAARIFRMLFRELLNVDEIRRRTGMETNAIHVRSSRLALRIRKQAQLVLGGLGRARRRRFE